MDNYYRVTLVTTRTVLVAGNDEGDAMSKAAYEANYGKSMNKDVHWEPRNAEKAGRW